MKQVEYLGDETPLEPDVWYVEGTTIWAAADDPYHGVTLTREILGAMLNALPPLPPEPCTWPCCQQDHKHE